MLTKNITESDFLKELSKFGAIIVKNSDEEVIQVESLDELYDLGYDDDFNIDFNVFDDGIALEDASFSKHLYEFLEKNARYFNAEMNFLLFFLHI